MRLRPSYPLPTDEVYVVCERKKNLPRINIKICERCRYRKKCKSYHIVDANKKDDK